MKLSIYTLLFLFTLPLSANAQTGEWFKSQDVDARLIAGSDQQAALQIKLAEGWHTYWRIPGDAGLPPMLSWAESENIESVDILWPAPSRKKEYEFTTFGYDGLLTLPLTLNVKTPDSVPTLALNAQIMICKDICIPQRFELNLDSDPNADLTKEDALINAAKETIPREAINQELSIDSIVAAKDALVVSTTSTQGFDGIDIVPVIEEDYVALTSPPEIKISEHDPTKAMIIVKNGTDFENIAGALQGKTLTVTLIKGNEAIVKSVQY